MNEKIRWGILGAGGIARRMADALLKVQDAQLLAVASRSQAKADEFGASFNIPRRYGSYEAMLADGDVDVVYVATPHTMHAQNTLQALHAGKAVLCEKPFTVNAAQARETIACARSRKLLLMEAMWTRWIPSVVKLRELLAAKAIGNVKMLQVDFGFVAEWKPQWRLLNADLAGGALLDVGCYCVSLASMILGTPASVVSQAHIGTTGVDEETAMVLKGPAGQLAILSCAVRTATPQEALVVGERGWIRLHPVWWCGGKLTLTRPGEDPQVFDMPAEENGFVYEVRELHRCLRAGLTESPVMPLAESLSIMETMDRVREQVGLKYPFEQ